MSRWWWRRAILGVVGLAFIAGLGGFLGWRWWWQREPILVGVLHSQTGPMAVSELAVIDAVELAIEQINARGGLLGRPVKAVVADGASSDLTFAKEAERLVSREGVEVIFGCWTSSSRKAVKPVMERLGHLLVYPVQYEGCETSPNIVYMGAAPNQQIIPAVSWSLGKLGPRVFLVGSDYIFPRMANQIIREQVDALGGQVVGEEYLMLGSNEVGPVVEKIRRSQADVVLNTINGDTNLRFFQALSRTREGGRVVPVVSFSIGENELQALSDRQIMVGHYAAWSYFQTLPGRENEAFVKAFRDRFGAKRTISDPMEAAYTGVLLWSQAVAEAGTVETAEVRQSMVRQNMSAPEGFLAIDSETQHAWKAARIGRIREDGLFDIVWNSGTPIRPAPFPIWQPRRYWEGLVQRFYESWGGQWSNPGTSLVVEPVTVKTTIRRLEAEPPSVSGGPASAVVVPAASEPASLPAPVVVPAPQPATTVAGPNGSEWGFSSSVFAEEGRREGASP